MLLRTRILCVASALPIIGCATTHDATKEMYQADTRITNICFEGVRKLPLDRQFVVSERLGYSPYTQAMTCYSTHMKAAVYGMQYPHAELVASFADYMIQVNRARDAGTITPQMASSLQADGSAIYRKSILNADEASASLSRKDLARRISVFAGAMSNVMAEQDRQRAANRPVTCHLTGVYEQNTVFCQ